MHSSKVGARCRSFGSCATCKFTVFEGRGLDKRLGLAFAAFMDRRMAKKKKKPLRSVISANWSLTWALGTSFLDQRHFAAPWLVQTYSMYNVFLLPSSCLLYCPAVVLRTCQQVSVKELHSAGTGKSLHAGNQLASDSHSSAVSMV